MSETRGKQRDELLFHRCIDDFRFFCEFFFEHYCSSRFNLFHLDDFASYAFGERGVRRVRCAPRGSGKSVVKALLRPMHDIAYGSEGYIVFVSCTEIQSIDKLRDISNELISNEEFKRVYGDFVSSKRLAARAITLDNGVKLEAFSSKKEVRGKRVGANRPTKIVIDDFEHSEHIQSEGPRDMQKRLYHEVFMNLGAPDVNVEVVGTILHPEALLNDLVDNPAYDGSIYRSIERYSSRPDLWNKWKEIYINLSDDGRLDKAQQFYEENEEEMLKDTLVLWEDREPYLKLQKLMIEIGVRAFNKEKQNEPMSDGDKVFMEDRLWFYEMDGDEIVIEKTGERLRMDETVSFGAIDPSVGEEAPQLGRKSDYTCILGALMDRKYRRFVHQDITVRVPPSDYIAMIHNMNSQYFFELFGVETNLFRGMLVENIREEGRRREKEDIKQGRVDPRQNKIPIHEIYTTEPKRKRIYSLEPYVTHGHILFNRGGLSKEFFNQLFSFPAPKGHDDCPDALELLNSMVVKRYPVCALGGIRR